MRARACGYLYANYIGAITSGGGGGGIFTTVTAIAGFYREIPQRGFELYRGGDR